MRVRFCSIEWDSTNKELPTEVILDVEPDCDIAIEGADILSDNYGFCIFGFNFEVLE